MTAPVHRRLESANSVQTVFETMTAPAWAERKAQELGDGSRMVSREPTPDGGVVFVLSRKLPDGVPGALQRFLPADGRVTQTDAWGPDVDGVRTGTWKVEIPGAPVRLGGTMQLGPVPGGSHYTINGECKVSVPLVGGKAETYIASMVHKLATREAELLDARVVE